MKFQNVLSFVVAAGITLTAAQQPPDSAIVNALKHIDRTATKYAEAVREFNGSSTTRLFERQHDVNFAFRSNTERIKAEGSLSVDDVFQIEDLTREVRRHAKEIHENLISKRPLLFSIGQGPATRYLAEYWTFKTEDLARSIASKVPSKDSQRVYKWVSGIIEQFKETERAFKGDDLFWKKDTADHTIRHALQLVRSHTLDLNNTILNENTKSRSLFDALNTFNGVLSVAADRISSVRGLALQEAGLIQGQVVLDLWANFESPLKNLITKKGVFVNNNQGSAITFALQSYLLNTRALVDAVSYTFDLGLQAAAADDMFRTPERLFHDALQEYETQSGTW